MTWTYNPAISTTRDQVRLALGDTDSSAQLFSDEEIAGAITLYGGALNTAAALADGLAGKFSRSVTFAVEGLRIENSAKAESYRRLAQTLRAQSALAPGGIGVLVSGVSKGEMDAENADTDRVPNRFVVGMQDFPGLPLARPGEDENTDTDPALQE